MFNDKVWEALDRVTSALNRIIQVVVKLQAAQKKNVECIEQLQREVFKKSGNQRP